MRGGLLHYNVTLLKQSNRDGPLQIQNQEAREVCKMKYFDTVFAYKHPRLATSYDRNDIAHV